MASEIKTAVEVMAEAIASVNDEFGLSLDQAQAALSALDAAGYAVVPKEPTREMWAASGDAIVKLGHVHHDAISVACYRAMLSAAQVKP